MATYDVTNLTGERITAKVEIPDGVSSTATENVVPKANAEGNFVSSRITDDGEVITLGEGNDNFIELDSSAEQVRIQAKGDVYIGDSSGATNFLQIRDSVAGAELNVNAVTDHGLRITHTWNNAGVPYDALRINVTDNASSQSSALLSLICGSSKFEILKSGELVRYGGADPAQGKVLVGDDGTGTIRMLKLSETNMALPTSNPGIAGALWNDGGTVKVSAG